MVQDLNDAGGVNGRKLEIVMRDSAADPSKAVSFAKELVYNDKVDVVCGPINSGEVLPTLGIISGAKTMQMVGGVIDKLIDPVKYPLAFRNLNTNTQYIKTATDFCIKKLNRSKIAIIDDNTGYGVLAMQGLIKMLTEKGMKPTFTVTVDPNKTDVTDEILKARASGADVIQTWTNATGFMARVLNARGEQQWDVPIVGNPSMYQDQVGALLTKPTYWQNAFATGYANSVTDANGKLPPVTQAFLDKHGKVRIASSRNAPERVEHCLTRMLPAPRQLVNRLRGLRRLSRRDPNRLSCSIGEPAFPSRPGAARATARNGGDWEERSHPEPRAARSFARAWRGWRAPDLPRSEHRGTLRTSRRARPPRFHLEALRHETRA